MKYRYHALNIYTDLTEAVAEINLEHPHWDVVSVQEFSPSRTIVVHRTPLKEEEPHQFATMSWGIEDIESLRPDWSEQRCVNFLKKYEHRLVNGMISRGRKVLSNILSEVEQEDATTDT